MPSIFLGKSAASPIPAAVSGPRLGRLRRSWLGIAAGCLVLVGVSRATTAMTLPTTVFEPSSTITLLSPFQALNSVAYASDVASAPLTPSADLCANVTISTTPLFPFIPDSVNSPADSNGCKPTYWNMVIIGALLGKLLYILNWLAFVLAVCMTIYAGLLYISGFANEANVKKAKSLLVVCYTGLAIVFGARIILLGFANTLSDPTNNQSINASLSK